MKLKFRGLKLIILLFCGIGQLSVSLSAMYGYLFHEGQASVALDTVLVGISGGIAIIILAELYHDHKVLFSKD